MQRKAKKQSKPEGDIDKAERLRAKVVHSCNHVRRLHMYIHTYNYCTY